MNGDDDVFADALSLPAAERAAFLAAACQGDPGQHARIEALLRGCAEAENFLSAPVAARLAAVPEERTGDLIGRYKLLQKIGEGGMGAVYLAGQEAPVRRRVALKIIKLGMDTKAVVTRFEAERQALAMMDHPNIARVFDGGATDAGRPYFVMELVRGVKITEYSDDARLSTRERLDLFIQVCHAIQHAHQKGIIHRDIKPSNILATVNDGVAVPKVIDFGIAKALPHLEERLADETVVTQFAALIGTPAYMSPEQAIMTSVDVDTRSDIYSLGVLLYEMLTGRTPFDAKELLASGLDEIRRTIREKEPARPSTKLATLQEEERTTTAQRRSSDTTKLMHQLQGDLDWIVMKCLEKDRGRRYETASGLAADLKRHLNHEAVIARPPSTAYRLQKTIRRNKLAFAAGTTVALALIAGAGFSTWSFLRERRALASETEQRMRADAGKLIAERNLYAAHLNLAQPAWDQSNPDRLRELLEETRSYPDRGFEWSYWQRQYHQALMTLRGYLSHNANVWSVAFSPDGSRIVTGNGDHNARVWDAATGRQLFTLNHSSSFRSVACSPDGRWIIAGFTDGTIKRWDASTGDERLGFKVRSGSPISSVAFSPDGERIVSGSEDAIATVSALDGRELLTLVGHRSGISSTAFSPDGRKIITGSVDHSARVWNAVTGVEELSLKGHSGPVRAVAYARDGHRVVTGGDDRTATIWNANSGQPLHTLAGHADAVSAVDLSPDGQTVVTGSNDRAIKIWNASNGRELRTLKGHGAFINAVAFSPDGRRILSGSKDQTAKVWDALNGSDPLNLTGHRGRIVSVAISPDSERIITASIDHTAKVWEAAGRREVFTLHGHTAPLSTATFSPDGKLIFTGSEDQTGRLWNAADGRQLLPLHGHTGALLGGVFFPDGKRIVTVGADRTTRVWDVSTGREVFRLPDGTGAIISVAISPDGHRIVTGGSGSTPTVWSASEGRALLTLKGHTDRILSIAFSPDGQRIVTGSVDFSARVWDTSIGREMLTLRSHTGPVASVAYSADGRRIVTASEDRSIRLWDATGGQELLTLGSGHAPMSAGAFSPNGEMLVAGNVNGAVNVWYGAKATQIAAWHEEERAVSQRLVALRRVRPGLIPFSDEATTAERYLAALDRTSPTEREQARAGDDGAIKRWLVLAPIPWSSPQGKMAFDSEQLSRERQIRPKAGETTPWANGVLTWQELNQDDFVIDFVSVLGRVSNLSVAYAVCYIRSATTQSGVRLLVGSDARVQVYLNEKRVYDYRGSRPFDADQATKQGLTLNAGLNIVMLKVVINPGARRWRNSIRFADVNGDPLKGITVTLSPDPVE
jgi:WD40 repeat protein/serine/threonine protein kinase